MLIAIHVLSLGLLPRSHAQTWKSTFHNLEFAYGKSWRLAEVFDRREKLLVAVIDERNDISVMFKIDSFNSASMPSEHEFFSKVKNQIPDIYPQATLLVEEDKIFLNNNYRHLLFTAQTARRRMQFRIYSKIVGNYTYNIHIYYPRTWAKHPKRGIPKKIKKLLDSTLLKTSGNTYYSQ